MFKKILIANRDYTGAALSAKLGFTASLGEEPLRQAQGRAYRVVETVQ